MSMPLIPSNVVSSVSSSSSSSSPALHSCVSTPKKLTNEKPDKNKTRLNAEIKSIDNSLLQQQTSLSSSTCSRMIRAASSATFSTIAAPVSIKPLSRHHSASSSLSCVPNHTQLSLQTSTRQQDKQNDDVKVEVSEEEINEEDDEDTDDTNEKQRQFKNDVDGVNITKQQNRKATLKTQKTRNKTKETNVDDSDDGTQDEVCLGHKQRDNREDIQRQKDKLLRPTESVNDKSTAQIKRRKKKRKTQTTTVSSATSSLSISGVQLSQTSTVSIPLATTSKVQDTFVSEKNIPHPNCAIIIERESNDEKSNQITPIDDILFYKKQVIGGSHPELRTNQHRQSYQGSTCSIQLERHIKLLSTTPINNICPSSSESLLNPRLLPVYYSNQNMADIGVDDNNVQYYPQRSFRNNNSFVSTSIENDYNKHGSMAIISDLVSEVDNQASTSETYRFRQHSRPPSLSTAVQSSSVGSARNNKSRSFGHNLLLVGGGRIPSRSSSIHPVSISIENTGDAWRRESMAHSISHIESLERLDSITTYHSNFGNNPDDDRPQHGSKLVLDNVEENVNENEKPSRLRLSINRISNALQVKILKSRVFV